MVGGHSIAIVSGGWGRSYKVPDFSMDISIAKITVCDSPAI